MWGFKFKLGKKIIRELTQNIPTSIIDDQNVTNKALKSIKWSVLVEIVSRTAQPIIFLILAKLLAPEDFGVVAIATMAISFSQMFWDAGLSKALIQTNQNIENAANVVFWTNLILGVIIYSLLFLSAPLLALFFKSPVSMSVLRVLGLQVVIASLTSVQQALFVRKLDFRWLFFVKLVTAFIPGLFSVPLAFFGYGAWALVSGSLVSSLINLVLLWKRSSWRPKFNYDWYLARKLLKFGVWVIGEGLLAWIQMWSDSLLLGRFLGVKELGVYRVGWTISLVVFGLVLNPFLPVLYTTFSRLQDNIQALKEAFKRSDRIIFLLTLPIGVGLLITGKELSSVLFGNKWHELGLVISIIGFMNGIAWLVGINPELYRAMGRPDVNTKLTFIQILYYLPAYIIGAQLGFRKFIYIRLGVALIANPIHVFLCMRMLKVSPFYIWYWGKPIILSTLIMGIYMFVARFALVRLNVIFEPIPICVIAIGGIFVYMFFLWWLDRPFVLDTLKLVKKAI
ncbi:lipopolysaccharide biosynthesis protein [Candidatus Poribacteria bacterium]|nr:lipopolysaccharide biosynthesis protein [Candidatus Poribacteria bacterium]